MPVYTVSFAHGLHELTGACTHWHAGGGAAALPGVWRARASRHWQVTASRASIYRAEGWRGLYKGSIPSIIKAAPAAAVTFSAYEVALRALTQMRDAKQELLS